MLQTILDIILYIPRKIEWYIRDYKFLKQEYQKQETIIHNQNLIFKRIVNECERTAYGNETLRVRKIKELAQTFPNPY